MLKSIWKSHKLVKKEARLSRREHQWVKACPVGSSSVHLSRGWSGQTTEGLHWSIVLASRARPTQGYHAGWWNLLRT